MRPVVDVMPLWDDDKESLWMLPGYLDGILLTGGHDVSPEIYGEEPLENLVSCCRRRDIMEQIILEDALQKDTPLYGCIGSECIRVNSYHHQAVKELAPELKVMAESEDGLVEAVYRPGSRFFWAVQWHPEFSYKTDENSRKIFMAFAESMQ